MKKHYLAGFVLGLATASGAVVYADQNKLTIESCADNLPTGHTFEFSITGSVDTQSSERTVKGSFAVTDGTQTEDPKLKQAVAPFIECVGSLIK